MVHLHIPMSYNTWLPSTMKALMRMAAYTEYNTEDYNDLLNRSTRSLIIEWWIHNIGYYLTLPFCNKPNIYKINIRFRDVDLERWSKLDFTPLELTLFTALIFTTTFEYALMDQEESLDWFTPSYYIRLGWLAPFAWVVVILIAIVSPIWAILKVARWAITNFLEEELK